jgi:hypothetical protein
MGVCGQAWLGRAADARRHAGRIVKDAECFIMSCMSKAHDHHYVPQMHLKRFATSANSRTVVVYDKEWKTNRTRGIKGQAYERDLYTLNCGSAQETTGIEENFLAGVDNYASVALDGLLSGSLDQRHREVLSVYIASLIVRNPRLIEAQQQHDSRVGAEMYRRMYSYDPDFRAGVQAHFDTDEEFQECWRAAAPEQVALTANREMTMLVGMSIVERIWKVVLAMSWTLMLTEGDDRFILGDRPVFSCKPGGDGKSPVGLHTAGQETIVPVSSRVCLVVTKGTSSSFVTQAAAGWQVHEINLRSAHAAKRRFFGPEVRREWLNLVNCFDAWDEKTEFFEAPNLYVSLDPVDNDLFRPLFG